MNIKMIPFDFDCHKYTQSVKNSSIFLQNMNMIGGQPFFLFKNATTFWDNPLKLAFRSANFINDTIMRNFLTFLRCATSYTCLRYPLKKPLRRNVG